VQIGVADAAGDDLDDDLMQTRFFHGHFFNPEGLAKVVYDGRFHCFW
jgi:hypothetical protein